MDEGPGDTSLKKHPTAGKPRKMPASSVTQEMRTPSTHSRRRHPDRRGPAPAGGSGRTAGAACGFGASFRGDGNLLEPETGDRWGTEGQRAWLRCVLLTVHDRAAQSEDRLRNSPKHRSHLWPVLNRKPWFPPQTPRTPPQLLRHRTALFQLSCRSRAVTDVNSRS